MPTPKMQFKVTKKTQYAEYDGCYRVASITVLPYTIAYRYDEKRGDLVVNPELLKAKVELTKAMIEAVLNADWEIDE